MRVLRIFLSSIGLIAVLLFIAIFFGREFLLIMAANRLQNDQANLAKQSNISQCQDSFALAREAWSQIRFINDREYNLETVCSDFVKKPILLEAKKLPLFVKKSAGTSGFIFDESANPSQLTLTCFGKILTVYSEANELGYGNPPALTYSEGPESNCSAFNYRCCQNEVEQGMGSVQSLASDCPKSCYASCQARPLLLSFNGRPVSDADSKMVEIRSGRTASFAYVLSDGQQELFANQVFEPSGQVNQQATTSLVAKKDALGDFFNQLMTIFNSEASNKAQLPITTIIYFGDGESYQASDLQGEVEHVYTCNSKTCIFEARLEAQDAAAIPNLSNELSRLTVKVSN
jgi:hypothetical protein